MTLKPQEKKEIRFERIWAMPNKWTFTIPPISELIAEEMNISYAHENGEGLWADPFAGKNSPAYMTNDIESGVGAKSCKDALSWLRILESNWYDGVLYDPPYSITQARMYGKKEFSSMKYWADCKNEVARIIKPGGKAICFGWNSMGLGKNRGFEMNRILLVPHGGSRNDTIVTVEIKI